MTGLLDILSTFEYDPVFYKTGKMVC